MRYKHLNLETRVYCYMYKWMGSLRYEIRKYDHIWEMNFQYLNVSYLNCWYNTAYTSMSNFLLRNKVKKYFDSEKKHTFYLKLNGCVCMGFKVGCCLNLTPNVVYAMMSYNRCKCLFNPFPTNDAFMCHGHVTLLVFLDGILQGNHH